MKEIRDGKIQCNYCGEWKDFTPENWVRKSRDASGFLTTCCKACRKSSVESARLAREILKDCIGSSYVEIGKALGITTQAAHYTAIRAMQKVLWKVRLEHGEHKNSLDSPFFGY